MKRSLRAILPFILCFSATPVIFSQEKEPIVNYQVLFSPDDHVADKLIALIEKEQKSIRAAVYCLMHRGIAKALIDAHSRGVDVEVIVDPYSIKSRSPMRKMREANVPIFVWNPLETNDGRKNKKRCPLMHDKFCILGDRRVWTGSFNFTFEATNGNRENVIVLENQKIATLYLEEFERLKKEGSISFDQYTSQLKK